MLKKMGKKDEGKPSEGAKGNSETTGVGAKQIPLTKWIAHTHSAPNTPSSSRAGSPARIRKAGEISPDETIPKEVKRGKNK